MSSERSCILWSTTAAQRRVALHPTRLLSAKYVKDQCIAILDRAVVLWRPGSDIGCGAGEFNPRKMRYGHRGCEMPRLRSWETYDVSRDLKTVKLSSPVPEGIVMLVGAALLCA